MDIKIGDYNILSDSLNLWITKDIVNSQGVHTEKRVAGYAQNFEQLYAQFIDTGLRDSDATTTKTFLKEIKGIREELLSLWPEILNACAKHEEEKSPRKRHTSKNKKE